MSHYSNWREKWGRLPTRSELNEVNRRADATLVRWGHLSGRDYLDRMIDGSARAAVARREKQHRAHI